MRSNTVVSMRAGISKLSRHVRQWHALVAPRWDGDGVNGGVDLDHRLHVPRYPHFFHVELAPRRGLHPRLLHWSGVGQIPST